MGQNERNAKSGTSVESCSLLLQTSLHFTTDISSAKSRVCICKHFVNKLPSPAVRCCDFFSVFMASQQRDYDIPMVTLALPLVRLDRSVFPPLPLLQSQKRFLATSANKAFVINHPALSSPLLRSSVGDLAKPDTKKLDKTFALPNLHKQSPHLYSILIRRKCSLSALKISGCRI